MVRSIKTGSPKVKKHGKVKFVRVSNKKAVKNGKQLLKQVSTKARGKSIGAITENICSILKPIITDDVESAIDEDADLDVEDEYNYDVLGDDSDDETTEGEVTEELNFDR